MSTLTLSTLVDLDTRLSSSSSNDSLALMGASTGLCSPLPLVSKFCLLPGTTAPTLSVKEKIQSFECGKAPVLEESALDRKMPVSSLTSSYSLCTSTATNVSAVENPGLSSTVATLKKIASEETAEMQQKRQAQKHVLRLRATVSHDEGLRFLCLLRLHSSNYGPSSNGPLHLLCLVALNFLSHCCIE